MTSNENRRAQLRAAATGFFDGLAKKDFDLIPYAPSASLRAPFCPGGVHAPLVGAEALREFWSGIFPLIAGADVWEIYYNEDLTAVVATAEVRSVDPPAARLRVADRFTVDADGFIVEQENHLDPRDVTNPGWRD